MAVGIIIGTAFSNVVTSLVNDIITPPFGLLIGGVDLVNLTVSIANFIYRDQPPVVIRYGRFTQYVIHLLIIALVLLLLIKGISKVREVAARKRVDIQKMAEKELSAEIKVLHEIRDLLAGKTRLHRTTQQEH